MSPAHLMRAPRCTAKAKQAGRQCARAAIPGGTVCRYHGGAAPQVIAKAKERLATLVMPALGRLQKLINADGEAIQLGAVKDILDRNGLKPTDRVSVDGDVSFTLVFDRHRADVDAS